MYTNEIGSGRQELSLGDSLAIYDGTAPDDRLAGVDITHVMSDDLVYVVTYVPASEDELYESMDMAPWHLYRSLSTMDFQFHGVPFRLIHIPITWVSRVT